MDGPNKRWPIPEALVLLIKPLIEEKKCKLTTIANLVKLVEINYGHDEILKTLADLRLIIVANGTQANLAKLEEIKAEVIRQKALVIKI
jgi:hypothetical protein